MEKKNFTDKRNIRIIDAVEYNGKYTDVATIRNRLLATGAVIFAAGVVIVAQFFWL